MTAFMTARVHAFTDDVLAGHDAVAVARLIHDRKLSPVEAAQAAIGRAEKVNGTLNAIELPTFEAAIAAAGTAHKGAFAGVPTFIKDITDIEGLPTRHGSRAVPQSPA